MTQNQESPRIRISQRDRAQSFTTEEELMLEAEVLYQDVEGDLNLEIAKETARRELKEYQITKYYQ